MSPNKGKRQLLAKYMSSDPLDKSDGPGLSTSALYMPPPPVPSLKTSHQSNVSWKADESDVSSSQDMIFAGMNFVIVGFLNTAESCAEQYMILKYGGSIVSKSFKGVPDYAVVPLIGATLQQTATEIITILWLESCIQKRSILPVSYYHEPVVLNVDKKPLEGCVLCLTGFCGQERQFVSELASALGAIHQEGFVKKSISNVKASSHLICKSTRKSDKLNAAIKWCRPAVFHSWLLACAASGSRVLETEHMVDPTQDLSSTLNMNSQTSRKPFESNEKSLGTPIDDCIDKLYKLLAIPSENEGPSRVTSKTARVDFVHFEMNKDRVMNYELMDEFEPYTIEWEDPVNVRRLSRRKRSVTL